MIAAKSDGGNNFIEYNDSFGASHVDGNKSHEMVLLLYLPVGNVVLVGLVATETITVTISIVLLFIRNCLRLIVCPGCNSFSPCESGTHHFPLSILHNE